MRVSQYFLVFLSIVVSYCTPPSPGTHPIDLADSMDVPVIHCVERVCSEGQYCAVVQDEEMCFDEILPSGVCDLPCPEGTECRFGECWEPDLNGRAGCELDGCGPREFCIAGYCTEVRCIPGETELCYSGPLGTEGIGECQAGFYLCSPNGTYEGGCQFEVTPREEVGLLLCNGKDDDCNGEADPGTKTKVDIVFAFDLSGSMTEENTATSEAIVRTASMYNDPDVRLGLVLFPDPTSIVYAEEATPYTAITLTDYTSFMTEMTLVSPLMRISHGSREASWDVPFLLANDMQENIVFRDDAEKIIVMFTDEKGQSWADVDASGSCTYDHPDICDVMESEMCQAVNDMGISLYVFVDPDAVRMERDGDVYIETPISEDFDNCATIFSFSEDVDDMVHNLESLVEHICD
jgi:hypothetical protein